MEETREVLAHPFEFRVCDSAVFIYLAKRMLDVCNVHGQILRAETGEFQAKALEVEVLRVYKIPHSFLVKG
jgi:hypothetical protein